MGLSLVRQSGRLTTMNRPVSLPALDALIICPQCDALYRLVQPEANARATCARCHTVLIAPRRKAGAQIIAIAVTVVILVVAATLFPFISIAAAGAKNTVSILDAALAFRDGLYAPLTVAVAVLILAVPFIRALLAIYVLTPVVLERPVFPGALKAFRLVEWLRPWSMAEIFVLGCAVALIKVADLADIAFGPAFWMFAALVVLVIAQDSFMCRWSVWNSLRHPRKP